MKIKSTPIKDLFVMHRSVTKDDRGSFTRLFGADELKSAGRNINAIHVNTSISKEVGTLRGIHYQYPPFCETKIIACTSGAIWDVAVDLRPKSITRFKWFGTILTPENGLSMIIPDGFGHAFVTLEKNSTAVYVLSNVYSPKYESGLRYDDPLLSIKWPVEPKIISKKDQNWETLEKKTKEINDRFK